MKNQKEDDRLKDIFNQVEYNSRRKHEILLFKIDYMLENLLILTLNKRKIKYNKEIKKWYIETKINRINSY